MTGLRLAAVLLAVFAASFALAQGDPRRSGYREMGPALQKMQDDDAANPAMLFVQAGAAAWAEKAAAGKSCADCHGDATASMKGVAARYPAFSAEAGKPIDLEGRINLCRTTHQQAEALAPESDGLLALSAYVALQSRGQPIAPPDDARLSNLRAEGAELYKRRQGQLNLSCANCHDDHAGRKLAGATIPQGHPTGYPIYRLEWQALGSLKRRLRNCVIGMRAEPWSYDAADYLALESFLMQRAKGMAMDAPGVRP
ncbi:sulfur oxidation c-type cytochrome SoxA [Reyranella sp.]|uniref:sulfur oxidation c-type cytochrome SoxA n=1 Tax=Reyranella sp. TaxID=1929291 RepID=UPI0025DD7AC9|nr:sulfur oxidation c-type cytochrome SoxA [Reyranella sp.]